MLSKTEQMPYCVLDIKRDAVDEYVREPAYIVQVNIHRENLCELFYFMSTETSNRKTNVKNINTKHYHAMDFNIIIPNTHYKIVFFFVKTLKTCQNAFILQFIATFLQGIVWQYKFYIECEYHFIRYTTIGFKPKR